MKHTYTYILSIFALGFNLALAQTSHFSMVKNLQANHNAWGINRVDLKFNLAEGINPEAIYYRYKKASESNWTQKEMDFMAIQYNGQEITYTLDHLNSNENYVFQIQLKSQQLFPWSYFTHIKTLPSQPVINTKFANSDTSFSISWQSSSDIDTFLVKIKHHDTLGIEKSQNIILSKKNIIFNNNNFNYQINGLHFKNYYEIHLANIKNKTASFFSSLYNVQSIAPPSINLDFNNQTHQLCITNHNSSNLFYIIERLRELPNGNFVPDFSNRTVTQKDTLEFVSGGSNVSIGTLPPVPTATHLISTNDLYCFSEKKLKAGSYQYNISTYLDDTFSQKVLEKKEKFYICSDSLGDFNIQHFSKKNILGPGDLENMPLIFNFTPKNYGFEYGIKGKNITGTNHIFYQNNNLSISKNPDTFLINTPFYTNGNKLQNINNENYFVNIILKSSDSNYAYLCFHMQDKLIKNWRDLQGIQYNLGESYSVQNDIIFPNLPNAGSDKLGYPATGFEPIGKGKSFYGNLNGNGFFIENFAIKNKNKTKIGLFEHLGNGAQISHLVLQGSFDVESNSDAVLGTFAAFTEKNVRLDSLAFTGQIFAKKINHIGGIIGINKAQISRSYVVSSIQSDSNFSSKIGGIAALLDSGQISHSYTLLKFNTGSKDTIGGIAAQAKGDAKIGRTYSIFNAQTGNVGLKSAIAHYQQSAGVLPNNPNYFAKDAGQWNWNFKAGLPNIKACFEIDNLLLFVPEANVQSKNLNQLINTGNLSSIGAGTLTQIWKADNPSQDISYTAYAPYLTWSNNQKMPYYFNHRLQQCIPNVAGIKAPHFEVLLDTLEQYGTTFFIATHRDNAYTSYSLKQYTTAGSVNTYNAVKPNQIDQSITINPIATLPGKYKYELIAQAGVTNISLWDSVNVPHYKNPILQVSNNTNEWGKTNITAVHQDKRIIRYDLKLEKFENNLWQLIGQENSNNIPIKTKELINFNNYFVLQPGRHRYILLGYVNGNSIAQTADTAEIIAPDFNANIQIKNYNAFTGNTTIAVNHLDKRLSNYQIVLEKQRNNQFDSIKLISSFNAANTGEYPINTQLLAVGNFRYRLLGKTNNSKSITRFSDTVTAPNLKAPKFSLSYHAWEKNNNKNLKNFNFSIDIDSFLHQDNRITHYELSINQLNSAGNNVDTQIIIPKTEVDNFKNTLETKNYTNNVSEGRYKVNIRYFNSDNTASDQSSSIIDLTCKPQHLLSNDILFSDNDLVIGPGDLKQAVVRLKNYPKNNFSYAIMVKSENDNIVINDQGDNSRKNKWYASGEFKSNKDGDDFVKMPFFDGQKKQIAIKNNSIYSIHLEIIRFNKIIEKIFICPKLEEFTIRNYRDLQSIEFDLKGNYTLENDIYFAQNDTIDYQRANGFKTIGFFDAINNTGLAFSGSLNGKNKKIKNLHINSSINNNQTNHSSIGLFGYVEGKNANDIKIRDLRLEDFTITGNSFVRSNTTAIKGIALVAYLKNGKLSNIGLKNTQIILTEQNSTEQLLGQNVSALVGYASNVNISNSYAIGSILKGSSSIAGLIARGSNINLDSCYVSSSITLMSSQAAGLIAISNNSNIDQTGVVSHIVAQTGQKTSLIGGLIAVSNGRTNIDRSFVIADLKSDHTLAGFISSVYNEVNIKNSYAALLSLATNPALTQDKNNVNALLFSYHQKNKSYTLSNTSIAYQIKSNLNLNNPNEISNFLKGSYTISDQNKTNVAIIDQYYNSINTITGLDHNVNANTLKNFKNNGWTRNNLLNNNLYFPDFSFKNEIIP